MREKDIFRLVQPRTEKTEILTQPSFCKIFVEWLNHY